RRRQGRRERNPRRQENARAAADRSPRHAGLSAARTLQEIAEQLIAVLPGRDLEPALAGAEEAALVGVAQKIGRLAQRQMQPPQRLAGELAARSVDQVDERRLLLLEAALQGALAHAQLARDLVAPRLAVGQPPEDRLARPVAGAVVVEAPEIIAGITLVQL